MDRVEEAARKYLSVEDYLSTERASDIRHEYIGGELHAMAGASEPHGLIVGNIHFALRQHLGTGPCKVFVADMKVRLHVMYEDVFYYPDVLVTCDPADSHLYYKTRPQLIFEVLSPETERYDRREKRLSYIQIPSLAEYVLVSQSEPVLTLMRRAEGWRPQELRPPAALEIPSLQFRISVGAFYEGVALRT